MLIIFLFSAQPASNLPNFSWADTIIKKGGHLTGYAILAFSFWYAMGFQQDKPWLAMLLTLLYALSDELHQSFVPGRHSNLWDVLIFDTFGAMISLWLANRWVKGQFRNTS